VGAGADRSAVRDLKEVSRERILIVPLSQKALQTLNYAPGDNSSNNLNSILLLFDKIEARPER
jgi:hypothetical protein